MNGGDAAVLYCFAFFYIFFAGGGPWSLDRAVLKQESVRQVKKSQRPKRPARRAPFLRHPNSTV